MDERPSEMKQGFSAEALELMSGQEVTVYPPVASDVPQAAVAPVADVPASPLPPSNCLVITAAHSVLYKCTLEGLTPQR